MIFVDANVPMYVIGADHPLKPRARHLLERMVAERERLVTDAEVLQEILHRYAAIGRRDMIQPAFDVLLQLVDEVFPIDRIVLDRAKSLVLGHPQLSARDATHVATMQQHGVTRIMSFDAGFDQITGVTRIEA